MIGPTFMAALSAASTPDLQGALAGFLSLNAGRDQKIAAIETALRSPTGRLLRAEIGRWIVERFVPVEALVPEQYQKWRPPVRDAMLFVVSRLSEARLAPKILEQIELPPGTPAEERLLRLISKVPGLQKLGQVLARNRHLRPSMRAALSQLENGIRDVTAEDMCALIKRELGARIEQYAVEIEPAILSEASVSAVVRFTWWNARTRRRERGVFKVLKPHIPACFTEDMDYLQGLAEFFAARYREYGFAKDVLTDTFNKVRRLLQHEIQFVGEQRTLLKAAQLYAGVPGVRVPQVIRPLCTLTITAISEEYGMKVTDAVAHMSAVRRGGVAEQLIEALVAVPLFAPDASALFHADPHAGNLLYNAETGELVLLDWALSERLTREQRRHLAMLVFVVGLRDPVGARNEIEALSRPRPQRGSQRERLIRDSVHEFFDEMPLTHLSGAVDALRLLQQVAMRGILFPAPLVMLSKVLFTLDGLMEDIGGSGASMVCTMARYLVKQWLPRGNQAGSPLMLKDWATLQCSALLLGSRLSIKLEEKLLDRVLPRVAGRELSAEAHLAGN